MKRFVGIFIAVLAALTAVSCVREEVAPGVENAAGKEVLLQLDFGSLRNDEVVTRATVSERNESQIYNFYVFVFDSKGAKISGQYFDASNQKASKSELENSNRNCWYVSNAASDGETTTGAIRVKTASGSGMSVYMIANLDADMVRVSEDLLAHNIQAENDLKNFNVYMNQMVVNRNGYFPMTGRITDVSIKSREEGSKDIEVTKIPSVLTLRRIDAKVRFVFKTGSRPDENGQVIKSFEARQWKVVNVPRTAYLLGYSDRGIQDEAGHDFVNVDPSSPADGYSEYAKNFYDTEFFNFEDFPSSTQSEFSFYMLENRQVPKRTPGSFQDRSRSKKLADGRNASQDVSYVLNGEPHERKMRLYEYANDFSTYVIVTGRVEMDLKNDSAGQVLGGDVQYIIHLGDWNSRIDNSDGNKGDKNDIYSGFGDFNTERNTSYTYTVTVNSVHNIRVEVETSHGSASDVVENQPGASGAVTVAKEEIILCDCHYVSRAIDFKLSSFFEGGIYDKEHCVIDELTWSVKTPFGEGEPVTDGNGMDITTGLDYQWVHFRLNKKDGSGIFSPARRKFTDRTFKSSTDFRSASDNLEGDGTPGLAGYHNDGIMDITQLVSYIKRQVGRYLDSPADSDFDSPDDPSKAKLSFTAFIDEFYYEKNPVNGEKSADLWKRFVNQDDRKLHILCSSDVSKDLESRVTGSVITIQQRAIQSIFNTDPSYTALSTAWGVENEDEYDGTLSYWKTRAGERRYNDDDWNGLYNTCKEWGLSPKDYSTSFTTGVRWGTFMDYEVANDKIQLNDDYAYSRYSCMTRNRDNNGDGVIDRNEVRWYLASINQLVGMVAGNGLLDKNTQLYNKSPEEQASSNDLIWQQHVLSSTSYTGYVQSISGRNSNDPTLVWAEEFISTGMTNINYQLITKPSVRCVRNLGFIDGNDSETYDIGKKPEDYVLAEERADGNWIFTATHLNSKALRYYTSRELTYADERSVENHLYKVFEVYKENSPVTVSSVNPYFEEYNNAVTTALSNGEPHPFCPEGYRTPSQMELAMMRYYMGEKRPKDDTFASRTYFSFGPAGSRYDPGKDGTNNKFGFILNGNNNMTVHHERIRYVRCVRDIRVN